MTNITLLAERLRKRTEWQRLPRALDASEYIDFIIYGIQQLYIMRSNPDGYSDSKIIVDTDKTTFYDATFAINEIESILQHAQAELLRKARGDVNAIMGYTTDGMSVTNADKPFLYITDTIKELEEKIRRIHYKMDIASL